MAKGMTDFAIDTTDVTDTGLVPIITSDLMKDMEPWLVAKQLLGEDRTLVGTSGMTRRLRAYGSYVDTPLMDFGEGDDVPLVGSAPGFPTKNANSFIDVSPSKFGARDIITEDAIDTADYPAVRTVQEELGKLMARRSDSRCWNRILNPQLPAGGFDAIAGVGGTAVYDLTHGVKVGTSGTILQVVSIIDTAVPKTYVLGTEVFVDCYTGRIEFAAALAGGETIRVVYYYTNRPNVIAASTPGQLTATKDISVAKSLITGIYGAPDTMVMHTDEVADIEQSDNFTDASKYGGTDILRNGMTGKMNAEIGKLLGLTTLVSQRLYPGIAIIAQRGDRFGTYVYKALPKSKTQEIQAKSGDIYLMGWEKSEVGVRDQRMMTIITNAQLYAKNI